MGESRTPRPEPSARDQLRACPMLCRQPVDPPSAACRPVQPRPLAGLGSGYATLPGAASPLHDASTARREEAASTLTLPRYAARARADWRLPVTSFAACLTRPDGTSARVPWGSGPVETTHPHVDSVRQPRKRAKCRAGRAAIRRRGDRTEGAGRMRPADAVTERRAARTGATGRRGAPGSPAGRCGLLSARGGRRPSRARAPAAHRVRRSRDAGRGAGGLAPGRVRPSPVRAR